MAGDGTVPLVSVTPVDTPNPLRITIPHIRHRELWHDGTTIGLARGVFGADTSAVHGAGVPSPAVLVDLVLPPDLTTRQPISVDLIATGTTGVVQDNAQAVLEISRNGTRLGDYIALERIDQSHFVGEFSVADPGVVTVKAILAQQQATYTDQTDVMVLDESTEGR